MTTNSCSIKKLTSLQYKANIDKQTIIDLERQVEFWKQKYGDLTVLSQTIALESIKEIEVLKNDLIKLNQ